MAKELPYFRFYVQEWQNGKISLEDYELQGLFINVCGFYWIQNCDVTLAMLQKRFKNDEVLIQTLLELNIFGYDENSDKIEIKFLNDQLNELVKQSEKRSKAGRKGGLTRSSNAKAMLKQTSSNAIANVEQTLSYKDKDKDNNKDKDKDIYYVDNIETEVENFESDSLFIERVLMKSKLPTHRVYDFIKEFLIDQKHKKKQYKDISDAKEHFIRWLNIVCRENKIGEYGQIGGKTIGQINRMNLQP